MLIWSPSNVEPNQTDIFRRDPKRIIKRISRAYGIIPKIYMSVRPHRVINGINSPVLLHIEFEELRISETVFSYSKKNAIMKIAYKIYLEYCEKIFQYTDEL